MTVYQGMKRMLSRVLLLMAVASTLVSFRSACGWEIHLRSSCDCSGPLVTLGDLAEVRSTRQGEVERLSAIELFPTPPQGKSLTIRRGDVRDMLALRSVDLVGCLLTGAQTTLVRPVSQGDDSGSSVRQLGSTDPLPREGGDDPDMTETDDAYVVVVTRTIQRGEIIRADDVELTLPDARTRRDGIISTLDEVIGREATRTLTAHRVIERRAIRRPLLVRRNDLVTVFARGGGVLIRTSARAMEDGSEGDVVRMQSPDRRKEYLARVVGIQEVEVHVATATINTRERR